MLLSVVADLHLDEWTEFNRAGDGPLTTRLDDQLKVLDAWCAHPERGYVGIVAGDIVHKRGKISPKVLEAVVHFLERVSESFEQVHIIPGNHDHPMREGTGSLWSLSALRKYRKNIVLHGAPARVTFDSLSVAFIPWQKEPDRFREIVDGASASDLLVAHQGISGGRVSNLKHSMNAELTLADLQTEKFGHVLLGDFHDTRALMATASEVDGKVWYVGSPYPLNRGESGDARKGFVAVDIHGTPERFTLDGPRFEVLPADSIKTLRAILATCEKRAFPPYLDINLSGVTLSQAVRCAAEYPLATVSFHLPRADARGETRASQAGISPALPVREIIQQYAKVFCADREGLALRTVLDCAEEVISSAEGAKEEAYSGPIEFGALKVRSFLSWGSVDLDLSNRGLVLIDGINRDAPGVFASNGAGKSVLVECLYFALFGKTVRGRGPKGLPVDALANRFSDTPTSVDLTVRTGEASLRILRERKKGGGSVRLFVGEDDVTPGGSPEAVEKMIRKLTGLDEQSFRSAVLFGQAVETYFAAGSSGEQEVILDQLAGTSRLDPYIARSIEVRDEVAELAEKSTLKVQLAESRLESVKQERGRVEASSTEFDVQEGGRIAAAQSRVKEREAALAILRKAVPKEPAVPVDTAALARELSGIPVFDQAVLDSVTSQLHAAGNELSSLQADDARLMAAVDAFVVPDVPDAATVDAAALAFLQGAARESKACPCPTCGQSVAPKLARAEAERRQGALEGLDRDRKRRADAVVEFRQLSASRVEVSQKVAACSSKHEGLRARLLSMKPDKKADARRAKLLESIEGAKEARALYDAWKQAAQAIQSAEQVLASARVELIPRGNPHAGHLAELLTKTLPDAEAAVASARGDLAACETLLPIYKTLPTLFKNAKLFLFDSMGPQIEASANDALQTLTDGRFRVEYSTKAAEKGLRERMQLLVFNETGAELYDGDSGGERRMVDLALLFALHDAGQSRVRFLKADEAISPCDSTASLRVLELFKQRAKDDMTVLFTSHRDEVKSEFPTVWMAIKEGGITRIEEGG